MMAHVRFTEDFDYRFPGRLAVTKAYPAGWSGSVKKDCADKAVAANKAVRIKRRHGCERWFRMISSGDLKERVALDKRESATDGAGNYQTNFVEQFNRRAAFVYAGGSEAVMAERLEGRSVFKIRLRKCNQTKLITSGWQLRDTRRGTVYAIREVDAVTHPLCVFLTVMSGVAS